LIILIQLMFTVGATLLVSCITIYLRDLRHALPILLQLGLFATPVAYPIIDELPSWARIPYVVLNPMAAVIDSYRQTVLYGNNPDFGLLVPAFISTCAILYGAMRLFRRLELRFADVA
jgi:ABC-2 type transport system permease protein/lipopolysaccharide transport system permease protein